MDFPPALAASVVSCLRESTYADEIWVWLYARVDEGRIGDVTAEQGATWRESDCMADKLNGKRVPVTFLSSPVHYAAHRPGTPKTPRRPPSTGWCHSYWCY